MKDIESEPGLRDGDLVIHVPADGSRGFGPYYVDRADNYGGNTELAALACLVPGGIGWALGKPKHELVVVDNVGTERADRVGYGFTIAALKRMAPAIKAARDQLYRIFPTFEDGRESVPLSEVVWPMRGFASNDLMGVLAESLEGDLNVVDDTLVAYATPRPGYEVVVERTAARKPGAVVMSAASPDLGDGEPRTFGYFAIPRVTEQR